MAAVRSYFQCPHCEKRYAASEKARAAEGKRIRCKQCEQPFTLTIVTLAPPSVEQQPEVSPSSSPSPDKKTAVAAAVDSNRAAAANKSRPRSRLQIGSLLLMVVTVSALAGFAWWWFMPRDAVVQAEKKVASAAVVEDTAKDDTTLPSAADVKKLTQEVKQPDPSTLQFEVSPACRNVAAAQWLNDYTLTHTRFRQAEFVRLLDESVSLTAQVHQQCQNNMLLLSVIESAKMGKKPTWLAPLINTLIDPEYDSTKLVGDEGY